MNIDVDLMLTITSGILLSLLVRRLINASLSFFMGGNFKPSTGSLFESASHGAGDPGNSDRTTYYGPTRTEPRNSGTLFIRKKHRTQPLWTERP